ncbi:MAG: MFS transporter [Arenicellales bacterium]
MQDNSPGDPHNTVGDTLRGLMKSAVTLSGTRLLAAEWRLLSFGLVMNFWSGPGQTYFISLFGGQIRVDLSLSHGAFGAIYSVATLGSALLMLRTGPLVDRIDLRKMSAAVIVMLALGCWTLSITHSLLMLVISIFIMRHAGQGLMFLCSTTAMVRYLEPVKGKASSIAGMGYPLGEAVLPSVIVALLAWLGWRNSWQVFSLILLLCVLPLVLLLLRGHKDRHQRYMHDLDAVAAESSEAGRRHWTRAEVLRDLKFYLILPGLLSQPLMFTGFFFHQVHLVQTKGWSLSMWGGLFVVYALVSVGSNLVCGVIIDRFSASRILPAMSIPLAIALTMLSVSSAESAALGFMVFTGITVGMSQSLSTPLFVELYGSRHIGSIKSFSTAIMVLSTAVSPVILGWFFDIGVALETLTAVSAVYIVSASALAYWACRRYVYQK